MLAPVFVLASLVGAPCDDARHHYEALSPESALESAQSALARDSDRPLACVEIRALALLVLGRREDARAAFGELFERHPDRVIDDPSLSPPLVALIEAAREAARPLDVALAATWISPTAVQLRFVLDGGLRGARAVGWRARALPSGYAASGTVELSGRVGTATVVLGFDAEVSRLAAEGAVLDRGGAVLHRIDETLVLGVRPLPPVEVSDGDWTWLLWAGAITSAAAAATVSIVMLSQPSPPETVGTIGRVDVDR